MGIVREARLRKKTSRSGSLPPAPPKSDQITQTSPVSTPRASTPDTTTKKTVNPSAPIPTIVKGQTPQANHQRDLVNKLKLRTDVLPDMPRRSYLSNIGSGNSTARRKQDQEPKNFASILSKWENRCHLSRAASVEVLNSQTAELGFRSRTNSTSTTTSCTSTSCLTPNQKIHSRLAHTESEITHRATIEQRPSFQETEKVRLPPLDSGPIFTRNRNRFGSSLTRYNSDTTMLQNNRTFDQVGDMGRYQYRQGPIGWKNPIQGL